MPTEAETIVKPSDTILVTGAAGFIGVNVVARLFERGFTDVRCLVRPTGQVDRLREVFARFGRDFEKSLIEGNLLSPDDCRAAMEGVHVVFHLAAGRGQKSYADATLNSVVTTRNLLKAALDDDDLKRFVNVSSFVVYSNKTKGNTLTLDETSPVEGAPHLRGEAYCYAKAKQDDLVLDYGKKYGVPYVLVRPGVVYGPGNEGISGRVGIRTFGIFLHLGGNNKIPLTYVENCAEAIVLAGLKSGVEGEVFNIVDDDLPSSRSFLRQYKKRVRPFPSVYLPHALSYLFCFLWEWYSGWSNEQLPPAFNRKKWHAYWKGSRYTNSKMKERLGWRQLVPTREALESHFESCRTRTAHA